MAGKPGVHGATSEAAYPMEATAGTWHHGFTETEADSPSWHSPESQALDPKICMSSSPQTLLASPCIAFSYHVRQYGLLGP